MITWVFTFLTNNRVQILRLTSGFIQSIRLAYCPLLNKVQAEKESWV
jgi:hypothetical protein